MTSLAHRLLYETQTKDTAFVISSGSGMSMNIASDRGKSVPPEFYKIYLGQHRKGTRF